MGMGDRLGRRFQVGPQRGWQLLLEDHVSPGADACLPGGHVVSAMLVQPRQRPVEAMRFDGTDAGAQSIALWVKESGDITSDSRMHFRFESGGRREFNFDPAGTGGWDVRAGQYIVRMAPGAYLVLSERDFMLLFEESFGILPITIGEAW